MLDQLVQIKVSPELKARILRAAEREERTVSNYIRILVQRHLDTIDSAEPPHPSAADTDRTQPGAAAPAPFSLGAPAGNGLPAGHQK